MEQNYVFTMSGGQVPAYLRMQKGFKSLARKKKKRKKIFSPRDQIAYKLTRLIKHFFPPNFFLLQ